MNTPLRLLMVEDSESDARLVLRHLERGGFAPEWERVETAAAMQTALARQPWDLILADYAMPEFDAPAALKTLQASGRDIPFIVVSGTIGEDIAVEMMTQGAQDYVLKQKLARLLPAVQRELNEARQHREAQAAKLKLEEQRNELLQRLQRENEDLAALTQVTANAIGSLDLDQLLGLLLQRFVEVTHADAAAILLVEGEGLRVRASIGLPQGYSENRALVLDRDFAGAITATRQPLYVEDAQTDLRVDNPLIKERGVRSMVGVPLAHSGKLVGVLHIDWLMLHPCHEREMHLLTITAERCAAAIVNAQLFAQIKADQLELRKINRAIEQSADAIIITNHGGVIEYVNPAFLEQTGYAREELIGQTPRILKSGGQDAAFYQSFWQTILSGQSFRGVFINRRKGGSLYYDEKTVSPLTDPQGQITHFVATGKDITERIRAEETMRLTTEKLRAQAELLDLTQDAIMVCDLAGKIQFWNKGAERLYGHTAPEAIGQNLTITVAPTGVSALQASLVQTRKTGSWSGELEKLAHASRKLTVQSRWSLMRNAADAPQSVLVVETDVTEKRQLEAERLRAQRIESIGTLANGIAHDINNILMPIGMVVPMLREQVKDAAALRWLDMMEANVQRGAAIVKQVLTFSRGHRSEKVPTQVLPILKEMANVVRETFPKTIQLKTHLPKEVWLVLGDATQMQQVLMNLAVNARDAMPEGGILTLAAENMEVDDLYASSVPDAKAGPHVVWSVADTGQGISPEHLERIFDPYFTTKEVGQGTGLGLSTVLGIVRDHHGFVRVESKVGQGTRFRVFWPAQPGAESAAKVSSQSLPRGKGELILVVDDEESIRKVTKAMLERYGYQVLLASDGIEALALITPDPGRIQALLTDLIMPRMDGLMLIRVVQKLAPHIKTLAATGGESASRGGAVTPPGIKTVLRKPFTPAVLLQNLRALLDGEPPPAAGSTFADS